MAGFAVRSLLVGYAAGSIDPTPLYLPDVVRDPNTQSRDTQAMQLNLDE